MKSSNISLSTGEKMSLVSNLSTMLAAGISILDTVDSLLEDSKGNAKKLLEAMHDDLVQGQHMYVTFSRFPHIFDKVTVNLIKASEEAGTLDTTLKDLKNTIKKEAEFSDKIRSAMTYPVIILLVFIGVLLMILVVVIPKISTVFKRLNVKLPLTTQIMITVSDVVTKNTIPLIIGMLIFAGFMYYLYKSQRRILFAFLFRLPVVSELVKEIDLTRFSRSMFYLLNSGIPITTALEFAEDVVQRSDVKKVITDSRELVSSGKRLSDGLRTNKKLIPSLMIKIIEAGEKSGTLDKSLEDISEYLDYQVSGTLRNLTALIEPIMLVFVGIMIGGMMLAIIGPIYGMIGQVGAR